ncbi:MAG: hypothetical protein OXG44_20480 [Gammaproteobacteria bacterium]|nr:hypothetical protein [Gammaproteobacteria bacterium]MDE0193620.1 hypothetical protein [Gammaproteobacteria bacterium]
MDHDRRKILDMLADGRIDADAAERLLDKLAGTPADAERSELMPASPRYLRVRGRADGAQFDARIPLALIRTGIKLEAMLPNDTAEELKERGIDLGQFAGMAADELVEALGELEVNVEGDKGEQIQVYCE